MTDLLTSARTAEREEAATARAAAVRAAVAAREASAGLARAADGAIDAALEAMARRLDAAADTVLAANAADLATADLGPGLRDRLRLDPERLADMGRQLRSLAAVPAGPARRPVRDLPDGLVLEEWRRPVGVVGANFEARPTVVVDIASQLVKSRNAGVLRTGSAAYRSAVALVDHVVAPALAEVGLAPDAVQLIRASGHGAAQALVTLPDLVPLVILRGSGESTRQLAAAAAAAGVRTLAHADGGAVVYLDASARWETAARLIDRSLDRLGVCNRLNLLLVDAPRWDETVPAVVALLAARTPPVAVSLPPHAHRLGHEWALTDGGEATVTVAPAQGPADAARIATEETSGLAAAVVAEDPAAAREFLSGYAGTGAFWNATPRLLDGFKLLSVPETGINLDRVPGPRGPVTFRDLSLRQYVVVPAEFRHELGTGRV
jgi:glutamate-5-semialdehyde dehydrogenase